FSWMFRSKILCRDHCIWENVVSILVLVDVSFEDLLSISQTLKEKVSILVLVDVSFEDCSLYQFANQPICFNPCSRGCFVRRPLPLHTYRHIQQVSILVLV